MDPSAITHRSGGYGAAIAATASSPEPPDGPATAIRRPLAASIAWTSRPRARNPSSSGPSALTVIESPTIATDSIEPPAVTAGPIVDAVASAAPNDGAVNVPRSDEHAVTRPTAISRPARSNDRRSREPGTTVSLASRRAEWTARLCHAEPMEPPRAFDQRVADTLALLAKQHADIWVATASADGAAHLVPLSYAWTGTRIVLSTDSTMVTARNLVASRKARLGTGHTRDVVMIDAELESVHPVGEAPDEVADVFVEQSDWDPRTAGEPYVFLVLRPTRIQAWREANEITGRTLMRDGVLARSPGLLRDLQQALVQAAERNGTERGQRLVLVLEDVRVRLVGPMGLVTEIIESVPIEALAGDRVHPQCHGCGHGYLLRDFGWSLSVFSTCSTHARFEIDRLTDNFFSSMHRSR